MFKMLKLQRAMDDALTDIEEKFQAAHGDLEGLL
jgi:hypothetical protein